MCVWVGVCGGLGWIFVFLCVVQVCLCVCMCVCVCVPVCLSVRVCVCVHVFISSLMISHLMPRLTQSGTSQSTSTQLFALCRGTRWSHGSPTAQPCNSSCWAMALDRQAAAASSHSRCRPHCCRNEQQQQQAATADNPWLSPAAARPALCGSG